MQIKSCYLALAILAALVSLGGPVLAQDKLDRNQLTPLELDLLPDAAVAVVPAVDGGDAVMSCAFSVDGRFATGSRNGGIAVWDLTAAAPREIAAIKLEPKAADVIPVLFTPDGKRLLSAHAQWLDVFEIKPDGVRTFASKNVGVNRHMTLHPKDPIVIYSGDNVGRGVSLTAKGLTPLPIELKGANSAFAFSPDGGVFAAVVFNPERNGDLYGSEIMFWKVTAAGFVEHSLIRIDSGFKSLAFTPDGKTLVTGSIDRKVRLWDLTPKQPVEKSHFLLDKWVRSVHIAGGGGYIVAVSSGNQIALYNRAAEKVEKEWTFTPRRDSKFAVGAMFNVISTSAVSPDGRHFAFSNHTPLTVILRLPIR